MLVGLLSFFASAFIAIPLIVIALGLLTAQTGLLVNPSTLSYKKYTNIFGITFGEWVTLETIISVTLFLNTEQTTVKGLLPIMSFGVPALNRRTVMHSRTYDLLIGDGISSEAITVNDFLTYKNARKAFDIFCATCNIEGHDLIAEKIAENKLRRSRR